MSEISLAKLDEPFAPDEIEWRIQQSGSGQRGPWAKVLAYVTSRAIQNRLDAVVGKENWQDEYIPGPDGGVVCRLSLRVGGEWITKQDGAPNTDIEAVKGGISDALKRAAVKWGIGRYLYNLEEGWANIHENGKHFAKTKDGTFRWDPPPLPAWALPAGSSAPTSAPKTQTQPPANGHTNGTAAVDPAKIPGVTKGIEHTKEFTAFMHWVQENICGKTPTDEQLEIWPNGYKQVFGWIYKESGLFGSREELTTCSDRKKFQELTRKLKGVNDLRKEAVTVI